MVTLSIVVPMQNEVENVRPVLQALALVLQGAPPHEIIAVDDGSTDGTGEALRGLALPGLRIVAHSRRAGQSAAIHSGVLAARGTVVCTLDGDGQNPPDQLPRLWGPLLGDATGRVGLVAGQRVGRRDPPVRRLTSRLANGLRRRVLADGSRDSACGLKAFRREAFLALPYFDHMHRYLPALFRRDGWQVLLVDVSHAPRLSGRSHYGTLGRAAEGVVDLMAVAWLIRRRKKATAQEVTQ